jgi:type I restriction enzyme, S subunit
MSEWKETEVGTIPNDWKVAELDSLCTIKGRIGWRGYTVNDLRNSGPLVLGATQISSDNKLDLSRPTFLSVEKYEESPEIQIDLNDILIVKVGNTVGKTAIINENIGKACINPNTVVLKKSKINPYFLYCHIINRYAQHYLISNSLSASAQPAVNQADIKKLPVPLPPDKEINYIASTISCLDSKINLLLRQNQALENIAQTIFKKWLIDFEFPDENDNPYKSSGGKMVESELGKVPEGWDTKPFYDLATYINGAAFKSEDFSENNDGLPIIKIVELKKGISEQTKYTLKRVNNNIIIDNDDILFSWSGSPETSIDIFIWGFGKGMLNQHTFRIIPHNEKDKPWIYYLLKFYKPLFIHLAKQKQTTGLGHVTVSDLKENIIIVPDKKVFDWFSEVATPLFIKECVNIQEIQTLTKTRDTLLPKLMSGQIRVKGL